jgi:hypothetical protein
VGRKLDLKEVLRAIESKAGYKFDVDEANRFLSYIDEVVPEIIRRALVAEKENEILKQHTISRECPFNLDEWVKCEMDNCKNCIPDNIHQKAVAALREEGIEVENT